MPTPGLLVTGLVVCSPNPVSRQFQGSLLQTGIPDYYAACSMKRNNENQQLSS